MTEIIFPVEQDEICIDRKSYIFDGLRFINMVVQKEDGTLWYCYAHSSKKNKVKQVLHKERSPFGHKIFYSPIS